MPDAFTLLSYGLPLFAAGWWLRGRAERRRLRSRIGGYLRPPAYAPMKDGGQPTPATGITALTSSYSGRGAGPGGEAYPRTQRLPNRPTAPGSSGTSTAAAGGNGQPPGTAPKPDTSGPWGWSRRVT